MRSIFFTLLLAVIATATHAQTVGFFTQTPASQDGYVLFAPNASTTTYLIDKCGKLVHTWSSTHRPGLAAYLLEDGRLLRAGNTNNTTFNAGGSGGAVELYDWSSTLLWSYTISAATECQHHDICYLPDGNILAIVWELKTPAEATAAGRNPSLLGSSLWSEKIVELHPAGATATIVWEWHVWDHLVQDFDNTKSNYDTVANHPELVDLNYYSGMPTASDWLHVNAVTYNADLDQIMVSVHNFSELWIIDHSTTTAEAASHSGGTHGKGGDLLYRWGNPEAYDRGTSADRRLYVQHNAHWIPNGLLDSGKIMVFNNGTGRPGGDFSTVDVIAPPVDGSGDYAISTGAPYLPDTAYWQYKAPTPTDFYGMNISGAQRLPNGNTIICEGPTGTLFEIDSAKNIAWKYIVPVNNTGPITQGTTPTQNATFRCTLYEASYGGFAGQTLTAGSPIELSPLTYDCFPGVGVKAAGTQEQGFAVVNPFTRSLTITAGQATPGATITLSGMDGRVYAMWQHKDLLPGQRTDLLLPGNTSPGAYLLRISNAQTNSVIRLVSTGE